MRSFLRAIDRKERRRTLDRIRESRIAQLEVKSYKEVVRKLEQQIRMLEMRDARAEGRRPTSAPRTEKEEKVFREQGQVRADQMSPAERERLERERSQMWGQIPEHVRRKAEELAGIVK